MNEMTKYLLFVGSGFLAGFINTPAGGGSMISLGIMMMLGIDPVVASATNRVGVFMSTASAVTTFKRNNSLDFKESFSLAIWTVPGAILGSFYTTRINSLLFQRLLMITMVIVLLSILIPQKKDFKEKTIGQNKRLLFPIMFIIGLYGGFIQLGVGYLMMSLFFHVVHMDLVKITKFKMFVVFVYTIPVIVLYAFTGKINWIYAIFLSLGNWAGAWVAVRMAIKKGSMVIKVVLAFSVTLMLGQFIYTFWKA